MRARISKGQQLKRKHLRRHLIAEDSPWITVSQKKEDQPHTHTRKQLCQNSKSWKDPRPPGESNLSNTCSEPCDPEKELWSTVLWSKCFCPFLAPTLQPWPPNIMKLGCGDLGKWSGKANGPLMTAIGTLIKFAQERPPHSFHLVRTHKKTLSMRSKHVADSK